MTPPDQTDPHGNILKYGPANHSSGGEPQATHEKEAPPHRRRGRFVALAVGMGPIYVGGALR